MNPEEYKYVINGWQALIIIGPSVLAFFGTILTAFMSGKNKQSIDEVKKEATIATKKIDNINVRQEVMHDAINSQQAGLIDAIKKAAYAEGVIDGIKKEQLHMTAVIADELVKKELINKDRVDEAAKIIAAAILAKDMLIEEAKLNKERMDKEIITIKENILHELNKKLIRDK
jgi:hypothetical protein